MCTRPRENLRKVRIDCRQALCFHKPLVPLWGLPVTCYSLQPCYYKPCRVPFVPGGNVYNVECVRLITGVYVLHVLKGHQPYPPSHSGVLITIPFVLCWCLLRVVFEFQFCGGCFCGRLCPPT